MPKVPVHYPDEKKAALVAVRQGFIIPEKFGIVVDNPMPFFNVGYIPRRKVMQSIFLSPYSLGRTH
jgi:hypothetical protein